MPIYEFECQNCGKGFEELIRNSTHLKGLACPYCQNKNVHKIVSQFSFRKPGSESSSASKCSGCSANSCASCL